jgi:hypothetical protein
MIWFIVAWVVLSVPVAIGIGKFIKAGRGYEGPKPPPWVNVQKGDE